MPMTWTAENDRLLLLKLIETHGISVNSQLIVDAWPKDAPEKPSTRAITERFVRLRKSAGIKAKIKSTPSTPRARASKLASAANIPSTPASLSKKRKTKANKNVQESDSEDDDGHMTLSDESETPTKAHKKSKSDGKGHMLGYGRTRNGSDQAAVDGSPLTKVKKEPSESLQLHHTHRLDPFQNGSFANNIQQAVNLRRQGPDPVELNNSNADAYGMPTPGVIGVSYGDAFGGGGTISNTSLNSVSGINNYATNFSNNYKNDLQLIDRTQRLHVSPQPAFLAIGSGANSPRPYNASSRSMIGSLGQDHRQIREPSTRKASRQASEGMSAYIRSQKQAEKEFGHKSSDEDSQISEFHGDEEDFI